MTARLGLSRGQLVLGLLLAVVLVVMAVQQDQVETVEPYDPGDTGSTGLRALILWLEEMGYSTTTGMTWQTLPPDASLLFIHPSNVRDPSYFAEAEVAAIVEWVKQGGTLVVVGPSPSTPLVEHFGVEQEETLLGGVSEIRQVQPLLPDVPGQWNTFFAQHNLSLSGERAFVPLLAHALGEPVVALQFMGDGVVWHLTEEFAFTNLNLADERIAALLPAILRTVPAGARALISTHHLAAFNALDSDRGRVGTLQDWLYSTPFGQATLLVMAAGFLYLLLQGRRLGPPLPAPSASRPREAAEYVSALAGLQRRIRQPRLAADHHRQRLKSVVGRLAQAPADLPDEAWLAQLRRGGALSPSTLAEISELLAGYAKVGSSGKASSQDETELIRLVQATDALLASLPRATMQLVR